MHCKLLSPNSSDFFSLFVRFLRITFSPISRLVLSYAWNSLRSVSVSKNFPSESSGSVLSLQYCLIFKLLCRLWKALACPEKLYHYITSSWLCQDFFIDFFGLFFPLPQYSVYFWQAPSASLSPVPPLTFFDSLFILSHPEALVNPFLRFFSPLRFFNRLPVQTAFIYYYILQNLSRIFQK